MFSNLAIHDANRGLGVFVRGEGSVEDILFANIVISTRLYTGDWWGKGEPIHVSAVPMSRTEKPLGTIRNVRFQNIVADSKSGILIYGTEESPIRDLTLDGVRLSVQQSRLNEGYGGNFDLRSADRDERALFKHDIPGLYAQHVNGLTVRGFDLAWADGLPEFFSDGIRMENFWNVRIDTFSGRQARADGQAAAISLSHGSNVSILNCLSAARTRLFLRTDDVQGGLFANNDLSQAAVISEPKLMPFKKVVDNALP